MHVERDLVAGGVAAVADDLDVAFLAHCGVRPRRIFVPELDLDDVGFQVIQHQITVDDGLQTLKQRVARLGVVGADLALFLVAVDRNRRLTDDIRLFLHVRGQLGGVFLQIAAQAGVAGVAAAKGGVQVVGHVLAFNFHVVSSV